MEQTRQIIAELEKTIAEKDATLKDCFEHMEGQNEILEEANRKLQMEKEKNEVITRALKDLSDRCDSLQKDLNLKDGDLKETRRQLSDAVEENRDLKERNGDMARHMQWLEEKGTLLYPIPCSSALPSGNFPIPCSSFDREESPHEGVSSGYQTSASGCESLEAENKAESKLTSMRVKGLENQLAFVQQVGSKVMNYSELKEAPTDQDVASLQEWSVLIEEKERTIKSLRKEIERYRLEVDTITKTRFDIEDQCTLQLKDLALRTDETKEAQRQLAESNKRLQQVERELMVVKKNLKEAESEKSYVDQQLCDYLKDFDEEKCKFQEQLSEAVRKNADLKECIQKLEDECAAQREGLELDVPQHPISCTSAPSSLNVLPPVPCSSMGTRCSPPALQRAEPNRCQPLIAQDQLTAPGSRSVDLAAPGSGVVGPEC